MTNASARLVTADDHAPPRQPVGTRQRLIVLDVLRGVAVLGLMIVHVNFFSRPIDPTVDMTMGMPYEGANRAFIWGVNILAMGKFMFLFALLFGAGVMFFDRKSQGERLSSGAGLWYRRMGWLAAIGMAHGVLLFWGDILFTYAICGMILLWWVRRLSPKVLLLLAACVYSVGILALLGLAFMMHFLEVYMPDTMAEQRAGVSGVMTIEGQMEAYRGSYLDILPLRLLFLLNTYSGIPFIVLWMSSGIMLFGMALTKTGILTGQRARSFYGKCALLGIVIGAATSAGVFLLVERSGFDTFHTFMWMALFQPVGIPLALGYAAAVILFVKSGLLRPVQAALAAVGRMALTNYIFQSFLAGFIFHGWGLGLFAIYEYPELFGFVPLIWAVNITFSVIWLRFFRFGPIEWLWRSLTYKKLQPMRAVQRAA